MQLLTIFTLLLAGIISIVAAANSEDYELMSGFKPGKAMVAGGAYAFKTGSKLGHQRLIVARVSGTPGNFDLSAEMFELLYDEATNQKEQKSKPKWTCRVEENYRYKADVDGSLTYTDIRIKGQALLIGNTEYNLLTNNCIQHINALIKQIKATKNTRRRVESEKTGLRPEA